MKIVRRIRNLFLILLAVLLIVLASLSALVETPTGSRWVVATLADILGAEVGDIHGNLHQGLDVSRIYYKLQDQEYRAEKVSFRWRPLSLLYGAISIQSLRADNVFIRVPVAQATAPTTEPFSNWPSLGLPLRIELGSLNLKHIQFQRGDYHDTWNYLRGSISLGTFHLRYQHVTVAHQGYRLSLTGKTDLEFPYETEAKLNWSVKLTYGAGDSSATPLRHAGISKITGDLYGLHLHNDISAPAKLLIDVNAAVVNKNNKQLKPIPQLTLAAEWQGQTLPAQWWIPQPTQPTTSGKLTATGNWNKYRAELAGDMTLPNMPTVSITAKAKGSLKNIDVESLSIREVAPVDITAVVDSSSKPQQLQLSGRVQWLPNLEWTVNAVAERLNAATLFSDWPSNIDARFSTTGAIEAKKWRASIDELNVMGSLRDLNIEGGGSVDFDGKTIHSRSLRFIVGANQFHLNGDVSDKVNLEWDLRAPLLGQLDGQISGSLMSKGQVRGTWQLPQLNMQMEVDQFAWQQYAVERLTLDMSPANVTSEKISDALVQSEQKNSLMDLQVPDAEALLSQPYGLSFAAKQLRIGEHRFSQVALTGEGSIKAHKLKVLIKSPRYGKTDFAMVGQYTDKNWVAEFTQLAIKIKNIPRWWLTSSQKIHVATTSVDVENVCLTTRSNLTAVIDNANALPDEKIESPWLTQQSPARMQHDWLMNASALPSSKVEKLPMPQLCLTGKWSAEKGLKSQLLIDAVPLRQFYALFKPEVYFAGVMDGGLYLSTKAFTLDDLFANLQVKARGAELRYQFPGGRTEIYPWRNLGVTATVAKGELNTEATMDWLGYGALSAGAQLNLREQKINKGKLQASFPNLAPLETLLVFANDVKGELRADLTVGGSFSKPYFLGDVELHNGGANLPKLGVDVSNMELQLNSTQAGNINLVSQMQSGEGTVSAVAALTNFGTEQWQLIGSLKGNDVKVISLPQLKATLSPNIALNASQKIIHLTGDAVIPWARANIKTLPQSATQVSDDVVIVDDKFSEPSTSSGPTLYSNINLALGDDVRFKGFGLDSQLVGKLNLFKDVQRQLLTTGYVSVKQGSYKAYNQTLNIERGRLIFQGDYENPGLDIRASREIEGAEKISVGLEVGGTLQRPTAKVFSVPSQSDSQAMMMLITGKTGQDASNAGALILLSAAGGLGGDSSEDMTSSISQFFRVDELEVKSDKGIDQSELWVGKYITPKLLVRYMIGVFEQAFSFGVSYQLTDELRIEAVSGEEKSVDLIYKIER